MTLCSQTKVFAKDLLNSELIERGLEDVEDTRIADEAPVDVYSRSCADKFRRSVINLLFERKVSKKL
jgi:predicted DNA-binding protein